MCVKNAIGNVIQDIKTVLMFISPAINEATQFKECRNAKEINNKNYNLLILNITYQKLRIRGDDYFETTVEETGSLTFRSISQILIATNSGKFVITIKKLINITIECSVGL